MLFRSMLHILRSQLLEPIQLDYEDLRVYSTMRELQTMFGDTATVTLAESIQRMYSTYFRTLESDTQDIIFSVWVEANQKYDYVKLREEGSYELLTQLFQDGGLIKNI